MKKHLHNFVYAIVVMLLLVNGIASYNLYSTDDKLAKNSTSVEEKLEIMMQVLEMIKRNHVDGEELNDQQLLTDAIRGMTMSLDPFSEYLPPREYKQLDEETAGTFGGIGVRIDNRDGQIIVVAPIQDTPAAKAGILAGDRIVEINGEKIEQSDTEDVSLRLRGESGTEVSLAVQRPGSDGDEVIRFNLIREAIPVSTVEEAHIIAGTNVGYLRVIEFSQPTPAEFVQALKSLQGKATDGLIIDLRNNPGGLLDSAAKMCSNFLPPGELVVSVEGRGNSNSYEVLTENGYKFPDVPLVILINGGSASAAEIMSSCLNDYDRAGLVGEKSFGKGSVQNVIPFPDGSGLKLTIAKYFTKSRREIHKKGIHPEMEKNLTRQDYVALYESKDITEWDTKDPHLAMALEYIAKYQGKPSAIRQQQPAEEEDAEDGE